MIQDNAPFCKQELLSFCITTLKNVNLLIYGMQSY